MIVGKRNFDWPRDVHELCLSYLPVDQIDATKSVCKVWNTNFRNLSQNFWRISEALWLKKCHDQNVLPDSIGAVAYGLETVIGRHFSEDGVEPSESRRCWKIVSIIAGYAPDCMAKVKAHVLSARIFFYKDAWDFPVLSKATNCTAKRFGIDEDEPTACMRRAPETNLTVHQWNKGRFLEENPDLRNKEYALEDAQKLFSFYDNAPQSIPIPFELPGFIPLRCFMFRDGRYKTDGDSIRMSINGRKVILICAHPEITYRKWFGVEEPAHTFSESLDKHLSTGRNHGSINDQVIDRTKELAKSGPKWIPVE